MKKYGIALAIAFALFPLLALGQSVNTSATATANQNKDENTISAEARKIRGWSESEKKDFLTTVKTHAQLKSGQDLDNFAKGVMIKDEKVEEVETNESVVEVRYKLPAKFLGVFGVDLSAIVNVKFETKKTGRGPKEVTVKFPWYRMFFSLSSEARAEVLQTALDAAVTVRAQVPRDNVHAQNGVTVQTISDVLKALRVKIKVGASAQTTI